MSTADPSEVGLQRFRKRPVVIEAIQYRPDIPNCNAVAAFMGMPEGDYCHNEGRHDQASWMIGTLEGTMEARPGDWIVRGVQGEFYPCKPDIFAATYEAVDA